MDKTALVIELILALLRLVQERVKLQRPVTMEDVQRVWNDATLAHGNLQDAAAEARRRAAERHEKAEHERTT